MEINDLKQEDLVLFSEVNGISELPPEVLEKWKNEIRLENWNGFLVFMGLEGYYHVPFDTKEELKKVYSFYSSIDSFVGKIDI